MTKAQIDWEVDYKPQRPGRDIGIGIIGLGSIARSTHLTAYAKYGFRVVGVFDVRKEATQGLDPQLGVGRVYARIEDLLDDPLVEVVDIATMPEHRVPVMRRAIAAGKHILAQKPFAPTLDEAREIVNEAAIRGLKVAVNMNGRWAPPWRICTLLIENGAIGEVTSVTHLYDVSFAWMQTKQFDKMHHFGIYDYSPHFLDISRCWLATRRPLTVRARDFRTPQQPSTAHTPWGLWIEVEHEDGAMTMIRGIGSSVTRRQTHPFIIHGSEGVIRGSILRDDFLEVERGGITRKYTFDGEWFPDGFGGTMGELLCAIDEDREPSNSGSDGLITLEMVLSSVRSAELNGQPVQLTEAREHSEGAKTKRL